MRACIDYQECYDAMIRLCHEARRTVYIGAWVLDCDFRLNGKESMLELLQGMSDRGVKVYILLTPNVFYPQRPPHPLPPNCFLRYATTRGPNFSLGERLFTFTNTKGLPDYEPLRFSTHQKYLAVDGERVLIGSVDISKERQGCEVRGTVNPSGFAWLETAVELPCDEALWTFCQNNFWTKGNAELDAPSWTGPFDSRSHEAKRLCELVDQSDRFLYIENQYLTSMNETECNVVDAMAHRLIRAMREKGPFHLVIVTNAEHCDSGRVVRFTLNWNLHAAIQRIRNRVRSEGFPVDRLDEHLVVVSLERQDTPLFVHSKVFIQDGRRAVVGSSNLIDRSLSLGSSDRELGAYIDNEEFVGPLMARLIAKHLRKSDSIDPIDFPAIFHAVKNEEGHFVRVPQDPRRLPHNILFRLITTLAPGLR